MSGTGYREFKLRIASNLVEPAIKYLEDRNISSTFLSLFFFSGCFYFKLFYKRPKGKRFTIFERIILGAWVFLFIYSIATQVAMIVL